MRVQEPPSVAQPSTGTETGEPSQETDAMATTANETGQPSLATLPLHSICRSILLQTEEHQVSV